jgi:NADH-quinone oxidoreductase subunit J
LLNIIAPAILFTLLVSGGVGVALALPRGGRMPQIVGAATAALAAGGLIIAMTLWAGANAPNIYFYIFSAIALGAALRVITHDRPVYAALYFVLTVIASSGLFLILSAEFMAFAMIIVYAGAILITYLFVIMLATQAPEEQDVEVLAEYDTTAKEPAAATIVGFMLLALLTVMLFHGTSGLQKPSPMQPDALLAEMPRKVEASLRNHGLMASGDEIARSADTGLPIIDGINGKVIVKRADGTWDTITRDRWPSDLRVKNVEGLGFDLLKKHPGTIEIAGVILLMAMLGAVVLSRKQVELDEDAKATQAAALNERRRAVPGTPEIGLRRGLGSGTGGNA